MAKGKTPATSPHASRRVAGAVASDRRKTGSITSPLEAPNTPAPETSEPGLRVTRPRTSLLAPSFHAPASNVSASADGESSGSPRAPAGKKRASIDTSTTPNKRTKTKNSAARNTLQAPSLLLATVTAGLPGEVFHQLAVAHLFPLLDDLPPAKSRAILDACSAAVEGGNKERDLLKMIDHDRHAKDLAEALRSMWAEIAGDTDSDDLGDGMHSAAQKAVNWLSILFVVGVENRIHLDEVFRAFTLVGNTISQIYGAKSGYALLLLCTPTRSDLKIHTTNQNPIRGDRVRIWRLRASECGGKCPVSFRGALHDHRAILSGLCVYGNRAETR